jgi:hypothetical protein
MFRMSCESSSTIWGQRVTIRKRFWKQAERILTNKAQKMGSLTYYAVNNETFAVAEERVVMELVSVVPNKLENTRLVLVKNQRPA